jgi:hypothetical protein
MSLKTEPGRGKIVGVERREKERVEEIRGKEEIKGRDRD